MVQKVPIPDRKIALITNVGLDRGLKECGLLLTDRHSLFVMARPRRSPSASQAAQTVDAALQPSERRCR